MSISNCRRALFVLAAVALAAVPLACTQLSASADEVEGSQYASFYHGTWKIEGEVEGKKALGRITFKSAAGGKAAMMRWNFSLEGAEPTEGIGILGIDPQTGQHVETLFESDGGYIANQYDNVLSEHFSKVTGTRKGRMSDGKLYMGKITVEKKSHNEFNYVIEADGKIIQNTTFARVSDQMSQLEEFAKDFAGEWVSESVAEADDGPVKKGETYKAYHAYKWSPDKEALYLTYTAEAGGHTYDRTKGIAGWDASKNAVVIRWFDSLGRSGEFVVRKEGSKWVSKWISTDAEGVITKYAGTTSLSSDTQTIHLTNRTIDGEPQPDHTITWKRKR